MWTLLVVFAVSSPLIDILRKTFLAMRQLRFAEKCGEKEGDLFAMNSHKWAKEHKLLFDEWKKYYKNFFSYHLVTDIPRIKAKGKLYLSIAKNEKLDLKNTQHIKLNRCDAFGRYFSDIKIIQKS